MAPHNKFKYDVVQLIQCVKERPCIWDKTIENYKDRIERKNAWEEIFNIIHEGYEDMSWEDKKMTGELIQNKWTNVRDTFVKTLKTKIWKPKRRYLFHDQLQFLTKVVLGDDSIDYSYNSEDQELEQDTLTVPFPFLKQETEEASTSYAPKKQKKTHHDEEYVPKKSKKKETRIKSQDSDYETYDPGNDNSLNFVEVDSKVESDPRLMNEDEAFFASLLPTVVRYTEAERLEFRMEVLKVMKRLMEKKGWEGDE